MGNGKCGGEIEACSHTDARVTQNPAVPPLDRDIFICKDCSQPYWWNERENSSPARAMKIADKLFNAVTKNQNVIPDIDVIQNELNSDDIVSSVSIIESVSKEITFELSERITIAVQNTEIREEVLDSSDKTQTLIDKGREMPSPYRDQSYLTDLFNKRDKTIKTFDNSKEINSLLSNENEAFRNRENSNIIVEAESVKIDRVVEIEANSIVIEINEAENLLNEMSLTKEISVTNVVLAESTNTRIFSSAYASVHEGREPAVTNWSNDFKE